MSTPPLTPAELAAKDQQYLWHPFTRMREWQASTPLIIARGEGIKLYDVAGRGYYDGYSSLWVNVHGHCVPEIDAAIRAQLGQIAHSTLLGSASVPSILLGERLIQLAPRGLTRVFYSDSGSEAVEIGLKLAYQYWQHLGQPQRRVFLKLTNAYHGDTVGAVSVGGMPVFHAAFRHLLFDTIAIPGPDPYRFPGSASECVAHSLHALDEVLEQRGGEIAGLIMEPLVQGAAGMIVAPPGFLKQVERRCRRHGILLLADEVATGFGRTGKLFACEHEMVTPDLMMVAKGLTGGYLPLSATLTSEAVFNAFLGPPEDPQVFYHGHSYTGNQLACAAALASLELLTTRRVVEQVAALTPLLAGLLAPLAALPHVGDMRQQGFMVGVEVVQDKATKTPYPPAQRMGARICQRSRELGMVHRPLGDVVVFMPPLVSTADDLRAMVAIMHQAVAEVTGA